MPFQLEQMMKLLLFKPDDDNNIDIDIRHGQ